MDLCPTTVRELRVSPNIGENYPFQFNFSFSPRTASVRILLSLVAPLLDQGTGTFGIGSRAHRLHRRSSTLAAWRFGDPPSTRRHIPWVAPDLAISAYPTMSIRLRMSILWSPLGSLSSSNSGLSTAMTSIKGVKGLTRPPGDVWLVPNSVYPFPDFELARATLRRKNSNYNALQTKLENLWRWPELLAAYTWSKTLSDAHDLLNGGSHRTTGRRMSRFNQGDYGWPPTTSVTSSISAEVMICHLARERFASGASGVTNQIIGGWSVNTIITLQDGQPSPFPAQAHHGRHQLQ